MADFEKSTTIDIAPAELFGYLSDVSHLPAYMPRLTSARPQADGKVDVTAHIDPADGPEQDVEGEAWVKVRQEGRTLQWGAPGPHDYHGELDVDPGPEEGTSTLTVRLHTERAEGDDVDRGVQETVDGIKRAVEEHAQR
jgi:uncharacterized protein YndB with AHSA1/START domain